MIRIQTNRRPVYCHECRRKDTFERNPHKDMKTETGRAFMLSWKCELCGHTALTTNPNYRISNEQAESKEVIEANKKD